MHIVARRLEIAVTAAVHDQRLVTPAKQMSEFLVPPIESSRVSAQEPFHARHEIGLRGFHHQMEVVSHEAKRLHLPTGLLAGLIQSLQKTPPIVVIIENLLAPVSTIHQMVNRAR